MLKKGKVHLEVPRHYLGPSSYPTFTPLVTSAGKFWVAKCLNSHNYVALQGKYREAGAKAGQKLPHNSDN